MNPRPPACQADDVIASWTAQDAHTRLIYRPNLSSSSHCTLPKSLRSQIIQSKSETQSNINWTRERASGSTRHCCLGKRLNLRSSADRVSPRNAEVAQPGRAPDLRKGEAEDRVDYAYSLRVGPIADSNPALGTSNHLFETIVTPTTLSWIIISKKADMPSLYHPR